MAVNATNNQKTIEQIIESTSRQTSSRKVGELGKDEFLNLLITQLKYQDPLKPVDDKEFIAQMAQFSSLEQMQNMNKTVSQSQAFAMIGKYVTANTSDATSKTVKTVEGMVSSVKINGGKTFVVVNGEDIAVEKVTNVSEKPEVFRNSNISAYTNLIGFDVKGALYDPITANVVGVTGNVKAIEKGLYEDYAVMDQVELELYEVTAEAPSTDPNFIDDYLNRHLPTDTEPGREVQISVVDDKSGHKVTIKAILQGYRKENGKILVTLNNLYVPVDSITRITPGTQNTAVGAQKQSGQDQGSQVDGSSDE